MHRYLLKWCELDYFYVIVRKKTFTVVKKKFFFLWRLEYLHMFYRNQMINTRKVWNIIICSKNVLFFTTNNSVFVVNICIIDYNHFLVSHLNYSQLLYLPIFIHNNLLVMINNYSILYLINICCKYSKTSL